MMGEFPFYGFKVLAVTLLARFFLAGAPKAIGVGGRFGLEQTLAVYHCIAMPKARTIPQSWCDH
jgi:hypothetical protein